MRLRLVPTVIAGTVGVAVAATTFISLQRRSTIVPDALAEHKFVLQWDVVTKGSRQRRYRSPVPMDKVKADFTRQMTSLGWEADETHNGENIGVYFGKGYYSKARLTGSNQPGSYTCFDLHDCLTWEGKLKSAVGLFP